MMTDEQDSIARRIVADIRNAARFAAHGATPPRSLTQAYALQDRVLALLGAGEPGAVAGWKIAANSAVLMARFGVDEPLSGRVLAAQCHDSPAVLNAADFREFAFEPEIVALIGATLAPDGAPFGRAQVAAAIARLAPGMELLDMRGADPGALHFPDAVAQNISNVGAVTGGPGMAPGALDTAAVRTRVIIDGAVQHDVNAGAPEHPVDAVLWLANHLAGRGLALEAGQIVLCGTHTPICRHAGPGEIRIEMSGLGSLSVTLV